VHSIEQLALELAAYLGGSAASANVFQGTARPTGGAGADGDPGDAVERCVAERDLHRLARCWVRGSEPDWNALHGHERPQRVELPAYPFAKERYWIDSAPSLREDEHGAAGAGRPGGDLGSIEDILERIDDGSIEVREAAAFLKSLAD
jgi:acyl transferase domain-containing protein